MFCSNCGHVVEEGARFCSACGNQLASIAVIIKKCPLCGKNAGSQEQIYCDECGTMLQEEDGNNAKDPDMPVSRESVIEKSETGDSKSENLLGYYYATGTGGLERDEEKARYYFEEAAAAGNANAQYNLAGFYVRALGGLEKNEYQAELWLKKAADQGHMEAQNAMKQYFGKTSTVVEAFLPLIGTGLRAIKSASKKDYIWKLFR